MELRNKIEPFPSKRNVFPYLPKESQRVPPRPGRRFPQERLLPAGVTEAAPPGERGSPDRLPGQTPPPAARIPAAARPDRPDVPPASSAASPASPRTPSRQLPGNFPETSRHPSPFLRLPGLPAVPGTPGTPTTPSPALPPGNFPASPRTPTGPCSAFSRSDPPLFRPTPRLLPSPLPGVPRAAFSLPAQHFI